MCVKSHQDRLKAERLVDVATDRHTDIIVNAD